MDEEYLHGGLIYYNKGLRSLFCIAINNIGKSYNFAKKQFTTDSNDGFNSMLSKYGQTQVMTAFNSTSTAPSNVLSSSLFSEGDTLYSASGSSLMWYLPDSMGMCVKTAAKLHLNAVSKTRCSQLVSSSSASTEADSYKTILFAPGATTSTSTTLTQNTVSSGTHILTQTVSRGGYNAGVA